MIKIEDLQVGQTVWMLTKNKAGILTSFTKNPKSDMIATAHVFDPETNTVYMIENIALVPCVLDMFDIGDKVSSIYGNFIGEVVAFELDSNKAICVSSKYAKTRTNYNNRCRYAYFVDELKHIQNDKGFFVPGKKYKLPNGQTVMCVGEEGQCMNYLVDIETGISIKIVNSTLSLEDYEGTSLENAECLD